MYVFIKYILYKNPLFFKIQDKKNLDTIEKYHNKKDCFFLVFKKMGLNCKNFKQQYFVSFIFLKQYQYFFYY